jgi:outer membrane receptor protein involved in Fe transport
MRPYFQLFWTGVLLLSFTFSMSAQHTVSGIVTDEDDTPLQYANIVLQKAADSAFITGTVTDELGIFTIKGVQPGAYMLQLSMVGLTTQLVPFNVDRTMDELVAIGTIVMRTGQLLDEVQVVEKKQMVEQHIDRMTINVANSATFAGGTALDVLERAPGVLLDRQNESISMAGKDGVQIMINGRLKYVPAAALLQMLQGMSADNLEKIELITTPPANLDAEGNAGYINLVLKSVPDEGLNGTYAANVGYTKWMIFGGNVNVNYRRGKLNLFGDYSLDYSQRPQVFRFSRSNVVDGVQYDLSTITNRESVSVNQNLRFGLDYEFSPRTTAGVIFSGYNNDYTLESNGESSFGIGGTQDTIIDIRTDYKSLWQHMSGNFNLLHRFNDDATITFDVDYLYYREDAPVDYIMNYLDQNQNFLFENSYRTTKITPISTMVVRSDYSFNWTENLKMDAGAKAVRSTFINELSVENNRTGDWVIEPDLTGKYDLDESIYAGYLSFDLKASDKMSYKFGVRYEHTLSVLGSEDEPRLIDRNYGRWFPSFFASRKLTDKVDLNFAYSRRIRRQTFNDMAPFVLFMDPFSFWSGNSALQPSISDNMSLGLKLGTWLVMLQYTYEDDAIQRYQGRIDPETNRMTLATDNMDYLQNLNLTINFPLTITKWWEMQNNFQGNLNSGRIIYEGVQYDVEQHAWSVNSTQRFTIDKQWSFEAVGQYRSAQLRGQFISLPYYGMNAGIQYKLKEDKGIIRFNVSDVFDSYVFRTRNNLSSEGLVMDGDWDFSYRTFRLTFSSSFGREGVKGERKRKEAEERSRVE